LNRYVAPNISNNWQRQQLPYQEFEVSRLFADGLLIEVEGIAAA
jgi:hypothetical protein